MTVHIMVEGASERQFFEIWLTKLSSAQNYRIHAHQGKGDLPSSSAKANPKLRGLLDQLPFKLRAFAKTLDIHSDGVLILVDADDDNPIELIGKIQTAVTRCAPSLTVEICIATEETEAFYLGDLRALKRAYPAANMKMARAYEPDSICGTWEKFGEVVGDDGGNKVAWAENMGGYVTTNAAQSRSPSFRLMLEKLSSLNSTNAPLREKRKFYHRAKGKGK